MDSALTHGPVWIKWLLGLHILAGSTAFLFAPLALVVKKGGPSHRLWGKIYFWAMAVVAASALVLSAYKPILFLALVAVFSFYAAFYAYRVLGQKNLAQGGKASWVDWTAAAVTLSTSLLLALLGVFRPELVQGKGAVSIVFGLLGISMSVTRMLRFLRTPKYRMFWWNDHLQGMLGSYIAAWTAFSSVTLSRFFGPTWYVWLWPTILGTPAIVITSAYYQRKFTQRRQPAAAD
jgi:uncharacterized membrane protein